MQLWRWLLSGGTVRGRLTARHLHWPLTFPIICSGMAAMIPVRVWVLLEDARRAGR